MNFRLPGGKPLSFYLGVAVAADALLIALVVLLGRVDAGVGPLRLQVGGTARPAAVLFALLLLRWALLRGEAGGRWREALFGEPGSVKEAWRSVEVLLGLAAVFYLYVAGAALALHRSFTFDGQSLGAAVQALWNTGQGRLLAVSLSGQGGSYLGENFAPALVLFAPLFKVWPTPEFLLRLQTLMLALGALPVFALALRETGDRRWATALAGLYLLHPAVRGMALSGFHPLSLAVAPLLWAFYLLDGKHRAGGYLCLLFALACGEEAWLTAAALGLYLCVARRRWREGLFLSLLTFYGFLFLVTFVMPKFGGGPVVAERFGHLGDAPGEVVKAVVTNPGEAIALLGDPARRRYLADLFLPIAGLSLLGPLRLAVALPQLAGNLLSGDGSSFAAGSSHQAMILPFLFAAAACGLRRLQKGELLGKLRLPSSPPFRWAVLVLPLLFFGPPPALHRRESPPEGFAESFSAVKALVPPDASLAASGPLVPRLAKRERIHVFPETEGAEYILVDVVRERGTASGGRNDLDALLRLSREEGFKTRSHDVFFLLLSRK